MRIKRNIFRKSIVQRAVEWIESDPDHVVGVCAVFILMWLLFFKGD